MWSHVVYIPAVDHPADQRSTAKNSLQSRWALDDAGVIAANHLPAVASPTAAGSTDGGETRCKADGYPQAI